MPKCEDCGKEISEDEIRETEGRCYECDDYLHDEEFDWDAEERHSQKYMRQEES